MNNRLEGMARVQKGFGWVAPLLIASALLAGCGSSKSSSTSTTTASTTTTAAAGTSKVLVGAGSTFVFPLVSQWTADYSKKAGVTVTYGAIGSGGGIAAVTDRSVDFGASDAPLTTDQADACKNCVEIPWALGGTSVAYHLTGAPEHLRLSGPVIADIYLGKITRWNDPSIVKLNPGVSLPSTKITPVSRSDASGTSYNFTDYLAAVSPAAKSKIGISTQPAFPTGVGAKGSSGVAGLLSNTNGSIGYVDVAYAQQSNLAYAAVENATNQFVLPTVSSIAAAAHAAPSPKPNAAVSIVDPPAAPLAYPISTFTYVIVPASSAKAGTIRAFLTYAITTGQSFGPKLLFAPLPPQVVVTNRTAIAKIR
jgi:phosphate transport system substrate-binding protein